MVRRSSSRESRSPRFFIIWLLLPFVILYCVYRLVSTAYLPQQRRTIVFLTNPVEVASFDPVASRWSRVRFPSNTHITGVFGLGEYAIDSLWSLAATEGTPSAVVTGSLSDELGIPIDNYVGDKQSLWKTTDVKDLTAEFFSFSGIYKKLRNSLETDLSLPEYVALTHSYRTTATHTKPSVELADTNGLMVKKLADNSQIFVIDRVRYDPLTASMVEDVTIRNERLRIEVLNTTKRPFLGSRVARIIDRLGANVIQVCNEEPVIDQCELLGSSESLDTQTAKVIQRLFRCVPKVTEEKGRADLSVKIGASYEKLFLPN